VRDRQPEHRHDRVADELLERAAVGRNHVPRDRVIPSEEGPKILWIDRFAERRRTHNVGEQHRHEPSLLAHRATIQPPRAPETVSRNRRIRDEPSGSAGASPRLDA